MNSWLLIALGGALGSMARFLALSSATVLFGTSFPYGTLLVNGIGCFFAGLVLALTKGEGWMMPHYQPLIVIGFLGAFTTFSTFSIDVINLLESGKFLKAFLNALLNVFVAISAAYLGLWFAK